ncbi:serine/threonine-protein phosphatase [Streptomyces sp. RLB3-17]|jgi:Serine phosphatase RsbU, regulator of sigma subunit|uniref:PP2C family protein-serine/threonine phosphatase n=1 Tax=Streptomyces mirabilis TaxID=68239 RepID=A0ABU3UPI6_9ACTN|nr:MULTISPECIES: PP2C family protein-serine/threonine phosphatase [Streptomyces]MCX4610506.1 serine/threonine-protein phosphatase [Streptomyces mirabilis]MCX5350724.1 serine/threonine-protein phosphatase [Streptomyces mirabilis]MDU8995820.1 PP2C family protein-serine/threonine phosphatase [Streptomyces mirabilis]NMI59741.1 serine/threonine-protein phosphatase [Streptomyces sp. RLA2-12]QDN58986.1 serine/threonine-protein phosphatase [Streptomyces sp. S1D4-20]
MPRRHTDSSSGTAELLNTLGDLTGRILDRIKVQQARVELAAALQRQVLAAELPVLPYLHVAGRYAPARDGLDIGGDWYDGFLMPDGSVGFVIGDVQGHDVEAAALMGQVRTCLRAVATATTDPAEVLRRTNDLLVAMDYGLFVTCSFLRFDPVTSELADARAGHIPAVWATADGRCDIVLNDGGLPLGIRAGESYPSTRRPLTGVGAFVLLTDGVVEGPSYPIEEGLEQVAGLVNGACRTDPDELAAQVIKVADLTGHSDDAAVLVLRYGGLRDERCSGGSQDKRQGER